MHQYTRPPVIRAYTLSIPRFDHLKAVQRELQAQPDADSHRVTNSAALEAIVAEHALAYKVAAEAGAPLADLLAAIAQGVLAIVPSASLRDIAGMPDSDLPQAIGRAVTAHAVFQRALSTAGKEVRHAAV